MAIINKTRIVKDLWKNLQSKWPIAMLAPMDGYTDSAYRQVNKKMNPDIITVSEFYSANWLVHSKFLKDAVLPHTDLEKPLIIQIFWNEPEMFVKAAKIIEQYNVAGIDVNMGCPAKKVIRSGHGSSLIITPDTAFEIVEQMNKHSKLPISVKTRLWFNWSDDLIKFWKGLENAWASLLTIHWRTAAQAYTGHAKFDQIYELKKNVWVPVVCNWDILDYDDWISKMQNLDWFMIWRKSFWNPWCFIPGGYKPTLEEVLDTMNFHADALIKVKWERRWSLEIRKHLVQYLHSFPGSKTYRKRLVVVESLEDLKWITEDIKTDFKDFLSYKMEDIEKES